MALRLIELYLPTKENIDWLKEKLSDYPVHGIWSERVSDHQYHIRMLISPEDSGAILDLLENTFSTVDGFRIILLPVETTIPKIEEKKQEAENDSQKKKNDEIKIGRGTVYKNFKRLQTHRILYFHGYSIIHSCIYRHS